MKILNINTGIIKNIEGVESYSWVSGEIEYYLIYDVDGDLYGVDSDYMSMEEQDYIVNNISCFDFPSTLKEYNN